MKYYLLKSVGILIIACSLFLRAPMIVSASQAAPFVATKAATYITEKSVRLNGAVNSNEMPDTTQWFEWGIVGNYDLVYQTPHHSMWAATQMTDVSADLVGLAPNQQYFFRQIAENSRGKAIGQTMYFTTKPLPNPVAPIVVVETSAADTITDTSANVKGYISPHGSNAVKWWFDWGLTMKLENSTQQSGWGGDSGPVRTTISGLTPGTVYFYRVVGENSRGVVYGVTKAFMTTGTTPPPPEVPRSQGVETPSAGDGVTRTVTSSGQTTGGSSSGLPGSNLNRPGDIFGLSTLFKKKDPTPTPAPDTNATPTNETKTAAGSAANTASVNQAAAAGASSPLGSFWNNLTGKKSVEVAVEKIGPKKVPAHTAIEYRISYAYRLKENARGTLKVVVPTTVVYIGDNTVNELLLEEGAGGERTYVLPLGVLENGSTRTISILGMTTSEANGTFPDARVRIEYIDSKGVVHVESAGAAGAAGATTKEARTSSTGSMGFLPSSIVGWLLYILFIIGTIVGIRQAKVYYEKRKEEIELEKAASARDTQASAFGGGRVASS